LEAISIDDQSKENISITSNNHAIISVIEGNPEAALPLYRRPLELIEQVHLPDGGEVMNALDNLASVYAELGDTVEALELERRAAAIYAAQSSRATTSEYASSGQEPRLRWYVPTAFSEVAWRRSKSLPETLRTGARAAGACRS
jgi:tetratricopeptide (TPR) repeat protein